MRALTEVGGTGNPNRVGDVIFVHGLNGDSRGTWSNGSKDGFWPHWLAEDCPNLGIWSLGYKVAASAWKGGAMPLFDRATYILAELAAEGGLGTKPICFIAHSMGGLLVKQMLRNADNNTTPEFKKFSNVVRGLIFLATPHTGSDLAKLGNYLKFFLRTTIAVRELESDSSYLRELNLWYRNNAKRLGIETRVFFEKEPTHGVRVVDDSSADPGIPEVTPIAIDANHINISKPLSKDELVYRRSKQFVLEVLLTGENPSESQMRASHPGDSGMLGKERKDIEPQPKGTIQHYQPPFDEELLIPPEHFIGREEDVQWLRAQLLTGETTSISAIRGMGGIGKTALAAVTIRQMRAEGRFRDGIAVVLCLYQTDSDEIVRRVLARFDPQRRQPETNNLSELIDVAHRLLDKKDVLVVLDNVEPELKIERVLIPLCAASATVLLTSRHVLSQTIVPPKKSRRLELLSLPEAMDLFAQSLGRQTSRDLSPTEYAAVERIVVSSQYSGAA